MEDIKHSCWKWLKALHFWQGLEWTQTWNIMEIILINPSRRADSTTLDPKIVQNYGSKWRSRAFLEHHAISWKLLEQQLPSKKWEFLSKSIIHLRNLDAAAFIPLIGYNYLIFFPGENTLDIICIFLGLFDRYHQMSSQNDCLNLHMDENVHYCSPFHNFCHSMVRRKKKFPLSPGILKRVIANLSILFFELLSFAKFLLKCYCMLSLNMTVINIFPACHMLTS